MSENWRVPAEEEDPLLRSSRREMRVALIFWAVFATWVVGAGKWLAYQKLEDGELIQTVMGVPSWVFWVVVLPWIVATVFTIGFATFYMKDHDLENEGLPLSSELDEPEEGVS